MTSPAIKALNFVEPLLLLETSRLWRLKKYKIIQTYVMLIVDTRGCHFLETIEAVV